MTKVIAVLGSLLLAACGQSMSPVEPGVSLALAQHRAATISAVNYTLRFEIPRDSSADISAMATIDFMLSDSKTPLQLDFRERKELIHSVSCNGEPSDYQFQNEHIVIPGSDLRTGKNSIEIEFIAGTSSLNRNPDYLYTLFVPDRARTAFPVFDQPDLKAKYDLTLAVPDDWVALSNAPVASATRNNNTVEYQFESTELISSYLFSFVAGKFETITAQRNGRSMTLLHRETDKEKVARNIDRVFDLHAAAIAWMEEYTGIKYPYQKFDFALIPSFQYGGMEHVGAIQYRAASLLLDASPSDEKLLNRARLIAHETAHMWFGNLVTMQWFNDVWTKEVFANFMAAKIINPNFPKINHDLSFFVDHYPSAYEVDRSAGANPIRQTLPNLSDAGQMYGAIIYHKAPIMMRQLELLLGEDALREGLREYLQNHAFANATWPDLIRILDTKTNEDLSSWSQVWVNSPGRPEFLLEEKTGGPSAILQRDSSALARVWPQQFSVRIADQGESRILNVESTHTTTLLPGLQRNPNTELLFNADGLGYGLYPADFRKLENWHQLNPVEKASSLVNHYENLLAGSLPDAEGYYLKLVDLIALEKNQLLLSLQLDQLSRVHHSFLHEEQRHQQKLETVLWQTMLEQKESSKTKIFFDAIASLATTPDQLEKVRRIWSGELVIDRLKLAENDYIELAETLAIRMPENSQEIISEQLARTKNPDSHRRLAFIAPALSASSVTRDTFFDSLALVDNRNTESWVLDALARLHHPSRIQQSEKYILPSLELLQEIQKTGDIFFPARWLAATLMNHHSDETLATVQSFLANRPDYNSQLRMKILQAVDLPIRANAILAR